MTAQSCPISSPDLSKIEVVFLQPEDPIRDYQEAMAHARSQAALRYDEYMVVSWYDRDRDYESPPNTTECAEGCRKNGYILYGLNHGAKLKIDIEDGRFVFFIAPVEW